MASWSRSEQSACLAAAAVLRPVSPSRVPLDYDQGEGATIDALFSSRAEPREREEGLVYVIMDGEKVEAMR
jgi:hypothetical protein